MSPAPSTGDGPLLVVDGLTLTARHDGQERRVVSGVSFAIDRGESLGLVGESGSGKTLTARAIPLVLPHGITLAAGRVRFDGIDVTAASPAELQRLRGARVGFVFQEPSAALSPVATIGQQVAETLRAHGVPRRQAGARALELLAEAGLPDPARSADEYPHRLSGGQRQRAMVAIALACDPDLLVADEPTTALDPTRQAEILDLLARLRARRGLALLLITHDLGVAAHHSDRIAVMYAGRIVEEGPTKAVLQSPAHPYTHALLAAIPGSVPGGTLVPLPRGTGDTAALGDGCAFAPRCPLRQPACDSAPPRRETGPRRSALCHAPVAADATFGART